MNVVTALKRGMFFLFVAACACFACVVPVHAQFNATYYADLSLQLSPSQPQPGQSVRVSAQSLLLALPAQEFVWRVDGKIVEKGVGLASIDVVAGEAGSESTVLAEVLEDGISLNSASAVIRPVSMDLLWEADAYTPPSFRGRALPSAGTYLHLEAIPRFTRTNGASVQPDDIVFTWRRNGYVIQSASGRGRARVTIESPALFGTDTIAVEASSIDGQFQATASAIISSVEPRLVLYEKHPLFGIMYHRALASPASIPESEMSFFAAPYYADATRPDDGVLQYEWRVNGSLIQNDPTRPNELTIDARGSTGIATIRAGVTHVSNFFLDVAREWNLTLSAPRSGNPFTGTSL